MARLPYWLRLAVLLGVTAMFAFPSLEAAAGVNLPKLERGKGDACVEDTETMRRHHMNMLKHQRDKTMRQGIRTTKHSLKGCVECHAGSRTGSVASTKEDFCMACHVYAGVKLDCWNCHATRPADKAPTRTGAKPRGETSPILAATLNGASQ